MSLDVLRSTQEMQVRGAPAIAITAALALSVDLINGGRGSHFNSAQEALLYVLQQLDFLNTR